MPRHRAREFRKFLDEIELNVPADLEMHVVLRTVLQHYELSPTYAPDEKWSSRGVSWTPALGGRAVVHRRVKPHLVAEASATSGEGRAS